MRKGLIARNPQDNTTLPRIIRRAPTVPTLDQVLACLDDATRTATPAVYALHVTSVSTGARPGELPGLPETAVDLGGRTLRIGQVLVRAGAELVYGQPKTVDAIRAAPTWKKEQRLKRGPTFRDEGLLSAGPTAGRSAWATCAGATTSRDCGVSGCPNPSACTTFATST